MTSLNQAEIDKFLDEHMHHRLTLLRTLRERKKIEHTYQGQADIYCCVKDSNLIAVRLLLNFLGLRGNKKGDSYSLECHKTKQDNDIRIDSFGLDLLNPEDVSEKSHRILAGVYCRADKELAHLTSKYNDEFNSEDALIEAARIVEDLLEKYLYTPLGKQLPKMIM